MALTAIQKDFITKNGVVIQGTSSVNSSTGQANALQVDGGAAIAKNLLVGTTATVYGKTDLYGSLDVSGITSFSDSTVATTGATGALSVTGGVYIGKNLVVASTATHTGTSVDNALYVAGGAWIDKTLVVAGDTTFRGDVTFNGTATYVYSTNTYYTDNIIELHTHPGGVGGVWTIDDGKDIGLRFHYYTNSTDTNAALVLANDTKYLEWYSSGAEGAVAFENATYGVFRTGRIELMDGTTTTNTVTGALTVVGGIGVGESIYAGDNINGATVNARNLTNTRLVLAGTSGRLTDNVNLTYNAGLNQIEGRISYANTSTNIEGGAAGSLVYQTSANTTGFVAIASTSGWILQSTGSVPQWVPLAGLSAGTASTATNLAGGDTNQIPYQSAPNATTFSPNLTFDGTTFTTSKVKVTDSTSASNTITGALVVTGGVGIGDNLYVGTGATVGTILNIIGTTNSLGTSSGALQVAGGAGIAKDLYVGIDAHVGGDLYIDGKLYMTAAGLNTVSASTGTFDFVVVEGTGTGLNVYSNAIVGGVFTSTGAATFNSSITVNGGNITGATTVSATNFTASGYLFVSGQTTLQNVTAAITTATALNVSGQSTLQNVTAEISTATTLNVTGQTTLQSVIAIDSTATTLNVSGQTTLQNVTAAISTATTLNVSGQTTLQNVTAAITTATTLNVSGQSTLQNVISAITTATTLNVTNNATVNTLTVTNTATMSSDVNVAGITTLAGKLVVNNATESNATNVGSIVTAGGIGVTKSVVVGGTVTVGAATTGTVVPSLYSNNVLLASYTSPVLSGSTLTNLDNFSSTVYRTARYVVQIVDGANIHIAEITIFHNGTTVYMTQYGISTNNGELGIFDANLTGNVVTLTFTPTSATAMTIKVVRMGITA